MKAPVNYEEWPSYTGGKTCQHLWHQRKDEKKVKKVLEDLKEE